LLAVSLLVVPLAELWLIVETADRIGLPLTLFLLIVVSVAGATLLRQQGVAAWRRLQDALAQGIVPSGELIDATLIVIGGALLLTPGFLTDVVGLALLLPPTRAAVKGVSRRTLSGWVRRRVGAQGGRRVYGAKVTRARRRESPGEGSLPPRSRADDSLDTR
jgi:UPF0716 protein FxsA